MSGRTPRAAINAFRDATQAALSCVAEGVIIIRGSAFPSVEPYTLVIGGDRPVGLRASAPMTLTVRQRFVVRQGLAESHGRVWTVEVVSYNLTLRAATGGEILVYHWHPEGNSPISTPHLHLESRSGATWPRLQGAHLPTGAVSLAAFVRCLIEELGVEPRRPDWQGALAVAGG